MSSNNSTGPFPSMKINVYFLVTLIYFILNSAFLPLGLLYTSILAPVLYVWLTFRTNARVILLFAAVMLPFVVAHLFTGVNLRDYFVSLILYLSIYIFIYAVYIFLKTRSYVAVFFKKLTIINFILTIIAVITLATSYKDMWAWHSISANINNVPRLKLFTYEPSYYSTLLVPLVFYFLLTFAFQKHRQDFLRLLMLAISLGLSFSLGVIAAIIIAVFFILVCHINRVELSPNHIKLLAALGGVILAAALLLWYFYPTNPLYLRLYNIFTGNDSSGRGRTFDAVHIAMLLLEKQDAWFWGIGLGQIKSVGYEVIVTFYQYPRHIVKAVAVPNAFAETLAIFGVFGATLRILLQVFLFFKTKVYNNYYQSLCFAFIFLYQFTGSYITNVAEYVLWLFAFVPYFVQFNKQPTSAIAEAKL